MTHEKMKAVPVTDASRKVLEPKLLASSERVLRQLRPHLPANFVERMAEIFAAGAEMAVVVVDGEVAGITVFRILEKTFSGRELYCDDLVTDEARRSSGVGRALMRYMEKVARERGCEFLTLDSGCRREQAHKFYFREGLTITSFHFTRQLATGASMADRVRG